MKLLVLLLSTFFASTIAFLIVSVVLHFFKPSKSAEISTIANQQQSQTTDTTGSTTGSKTDTTTGTTSSSIIKQKPPDKISTSSINTTSASILWSGDPSVKYVINLRTLLPAITNTTFDAQPTGFTTSSSTQTITNLNAGTDYLISMAAHNSDGSLSPYSQEFPFSTIFDAPSNLSISVDSTSATISWDMKLTDISNQHYLIKTQSTTIGALIPADFTTNTNTSKIVNLTSNTTYTFNVIAINSAGSSLSSVISKLLLPSAISNFVSSSTATTITISWSDNHVDSYKVGSYISSAGFKQEQTIQVVNPTAFYQNLQSNLSYSFDIRSVNASGSSSYFSTIVSTKPLPQVNFIYNSYYPGTTLGYSMYLSWKAIQDASYYAFNLYRNGGTISEYAINIPDTHNQSIYDQTINNLTTNDSFRANVQAFNSSGQAVATPADYYFTGGTN